MPTPPQAFVIADPTFQSKLVTTTTSGVKQLLDVNVVGGGGPSTVTANQGTPAVTANAWPILVTDGVDTAAVKPASTAAVATDPALVVAISPNNPITTTEATAGTATLSNVASSIASVTLLAANTSRLGATIYNDSTRDLYVKFGTTASTTSFTVLMTKNSYYEIPFKYTGRIDGIWSLVNGSARITELTT